MRSRPVSARRMAIAGLIMAGCMVVALGTPYYFALLVKYLP